MRRHSQTADVWLAVIVWFGLCVVGNHFFFFLLSRTLDIRPEAAFVFFCFVFFPQKPFFRLKQSYIKGVSITFPGLNLCSFKDSLFLGQENQNFRERLSENSALLETGVLGLVSSSVLV